MKQKSVSLRSNIAQKFPKELEEKITNFQKFVTQLCKKAQLQFWHDWEYG